MTADRPRILAVALTLALGVLACDSPHIGVVGPGSDVYTGYNPSSITGFLYHWPAGYSIKLFVDSRNEPDGADLTAAVNQAITAWEPVARLGEIRMHLVSDVHDADVIFRNAQAPSLVSSDQCQQFNVGSGGVTFFCVPDVTPVPLRFVDGSAGRVLMEVTVNVFALDTTSFFPSLVIHEMGHVLGIGSHSPDPSDLMYGRPRLFRPTDADAATLRYVLSQPPDVRF